MFEDNIGVVNEIQSDTPELFKAIIEDIVNHPMSKYLGFKEYISYLFSKINTCVPYTARHIPLNIKF